MEHLDIPHIFFHSHLLERKQKIWERGAACLWPLVCPADKHPGDSSRNEAGTVNRSITVAYSLLFHSVWLTVRATLLSRCFVFTLFCYHNFLYFLSFFHSYLINPFTVYPCMHPSIIHLSSIHPSTHSSQMMTSYVPGSVLYTDSKEKREWFLPPSLVGEAYANIWYIFNICKRPQLVAEAEVCIRLRDCLHSKVGHRLQLSPPEVDFLS